MNRASSTTLSLPIFFTFLLLVLKGHDASGQSIFQINGYVKDIKSNIPLPFANVFINNSTIGTTTDENGFFNLSVEQIGKYKLVVSYVGYEIKEREIQFTQASEVNRSIPIGTIFLSPIQKLLDEVQVTAKRDRDWEKNIKLFKDIFLGNNISSKETTIVNLGVVDLKRENENLIGVADEPILIENLYLGYRVTYFLKTFRASREDFLIEGRAKFDELPAISNSQKVKWLRNREKVYKGSLQHFLYSCLTNSIDKEGYKIYFDSADVDLPIHIATNNLFDVYEKSLSRAERLLEITTLDSIVYSMRLKKRLEIHYLNEKTTKRYYSDVPYQVSRLKSKDEINYLYNGTPLLANWDLWGSMAEKRIGDLLPIDYNSQSKNQIRLTGKIVDSKTGKTIEGATVFLNKTTIGNGTARDGSFALADIPNGYFDLVVIKAGYEPFFSKINIENLKSYALSLKINPIVHTDRLTKGAKNRTTFNIVDYISSKVNIQKKDSFQFLNPHVVRFAKTKEANFIFAEQPLEFQNNLTGYRMLFYMFPQEINIKDGGLKGYYWFNPLPAQSSRQSTQFEYYRNKYYRGSQTHFMSSLCANRLNNEGFYLVDSKGGKNTPNVEAVASMPGYYMIDLSQIKTISFCHATALSDFYDNNLLEKSTISNYDSIVLVNQRGILLNENSTLFEGRLGGQFCPKVLPLDLSVTLENTVFDEMTKYKEAVTIHTSKAYYQKSETIYLAAYMHYSDTSYRDALSRILVVELINNKNQVVQAKKLEIRKGIAVGSILLDKNIEPGLFRIRAYTSWMRNFQSDFFEKYVEILPRDMNFSPQPNLKAPCQLSSQGNLAVVLEASKRSYSRKEKIDLSISIADSLSKTIQGKFSVSVVDANVVFERQKVTSSKLSTKSFLDTIVYPIERAISIKGRLQNPIIQDTRIQFVNLANQLFFETEVDESGNFFLTLPDFTDSISLNAIGVNVNSTFRPELEIQRPSTPPMANFTDQPIGQAATVNDKITFDDRLALSNQNSLDEEATLLQEVVIAANKIAQIPASKSNLIKPEYSIKADKINSMGSNLLIGLAGKIPGLEVRCIGTGCTVFFSRASGGSIMLGKEPLVLLNGAPLYGQSAGEIFAQIDPSSIERIEIQKSINVLFGSDGRNGVIALYTKIGFDEKSYQSITNSNQTSLKISGFSKVTSLSPPNYGKSTTTFDDNLDYRSTLFWEPSAQTNATKTRVSLSFFAADVATTYLVRVEGYTNFGKYFLATKCIMVER